MNNIYKDKVTEIVNLHGKTRDKVIPILQSVQQEYNYLPTEALMYVCDITEITPARILGVATFYSQFRHFPAGKHLVKICVGTACHVKGALLVYDAFSRHLKLEKGKDTDEEGIFTIEQVACLGCCTLAPVVQIDDVTYGHVQQNDIANIITNFLSRENEVAEGKSLKNKNTQENDEIRLGLGSCCVASGSEAVKNTLISLLDQTGISPNIKQVGCIGMCHQVPVIEIVNAGKEPVTYSKVQPEDVKDILFKHFKPAGFFKRLQHKLLNNLEQLYLSDFESSAEKCHLNVREKQVTDFLGKQIHIATEHKGVLNPVDLLEYKQNDGFKALSKILFGTKPADVINTIKNSGLKGRGGAGFLSGVKWEMVANALHEERIIICNGDEGDPGAFMDRMLLESFPFRVIEGMLIAGYATGANQGYFYIRAEYPLAVKRILDALEECKKHRLLGDNILGSQFSFHLEVFQGAGAFVCGEETALISSIQGSRGTPRVRPPFPAESGLFKKPTLVNNVETYSNIAWIIRNGAEKFAAIGTETSKGTKVFALAGKIARGGLIEVPMGITIGEIVEEIGGGIANNGTFKAVQIGGPSGGCIPAELAHTPIDYKHLTEIGAMMGSGGLVVLDNTDCVIDIAKYFLTFTQDQSCGKCVFCRVGTKHLLEILNRITSGNGTMADLEKLEILSLQVKLGSLCGLGKTAPNPILTTLKYFRHEFEEHIHKRCPAKKCKDLIYYQINNKCIGCTKCAQDCPVQAIAFKPMEIHSIEHEKCIKCNICKQICPADAVEIMTGL